MPALRQTTHNAWLLLENRCRSTLRSRLGRKLLSRKESEKRGRVFTKGSGAEGQYCPLSGVGAALLFRSRNTICCTHFTRNMYGLEYFKEWLEFHPQMNSQDIIKFFKLQNRLCLLLILLVEKEKLMYFASWWGVSFFSPSQLIYCQSLKPCKVRNTHLVSEEAIEQEGQARQTQRYCETSAIP